MSHKLLHSALALISNSVYVLLAITTVALAAVAFALSRNVYRIALRTQARSNMRREDKLTNEQISFRNAMEAEEKIETLLRSAGWKDIFLRRRVAVARVGHNREIDAIAVGPVILVVEVKNWQGYVWSKGGSWYQCRHLKTMNTLQFEDVQEDNVEKAAALRRYIENTRRVALPDSSMVQADSVIFGHGKSSQKAGEGSHGTWYSDRAIHKVCGKCVVPVVVFTHPRVKLDPATVKAKKYVFTLDTFTSFAQQALHGNIDLEAPNDVPPPPSWKSWLPFTKPTHKLNAAAVRASQPYFLNEKQQDEVAAAVDVIRSWDMVYLLDGRLLTGDMQKIDVPSAFCAYERKHLLDVNVRWNRGPLGLLKTFFTNKAGTVELVLTTAKRLAKKRKEKKPRNTQGNIVFPMLPKKLRGNDIIVMKMAGTAVRKTVLLCDVDRISLSHHLYDSEKELQ